MHAGKQCRQRCHSNLNINEFKSQRAEVLFNGILVSVCCWLTFNWHFLKHPMELNCKCMNIKFDEISHSNNTETWNLLILEVKKLEMKWKPNILEFNSWVMTLIGLIFQNCISLNDCYNSFDFSRSDKYYYFKNWSKYLAKFSSKDSICTVKLLKISIASNKVRCGNCVLRLLYRFVSVGLLMYVCKVKPKFNYSDLN